MADSQYRRLVAAEAALVEAQDHLEKEKGFFARMMHERNEYRQQVTQQADTIQQLSNDLRKYGLHRADCQGTGRFCTCGFRAALASLPK